MARIAPEDLSDYSDVPWYYEDHTSGVPDIGDAGEVSHAWRACLDKVVVECCCCRWEEL